VRARFLIPLLLLANAGVARADVIEISDDGEARVFGVSATPAGRLDRISSVGDIAPINDPFENAARTYGVDANLLRAVAWTESRGRSDALSPKGALGIMQLMPATAAQLGVDPRDPVANINGGAAYLAQQIATFRDVPLALAAYNAGPGAVIRYGGIPPYAETRGYVIRIMGRWRPADAIVPSAVSTGSATPDGRAPAPAAQLTPVLLIEVPG
jgi:Transglycosylase SLT domain